MGEGGEQTEKVGGGGNRGEEEGGGGERRDEAGGGDSAADWRQGAGPAGATGLTGGELQAGEAVDEERGGRSEQANAEAIGVRWQRAKGAEVGMAML